MKISIEVEISDDVEVEIIDGHITLREYNRETVSMTMEQFGVLRTIVSKYEEAREKFLSGI